MLHVKISAEDFDGLAEDGADGYFLTTVGKSALWHLNKNQKMKKLSEGAEYFGDIDYLPECNRLLLARGNV